MVIVGMEDDIWKIFGIWKIFDILQLIKLLSKKYFKIFFGKEV